MNTKTPPLDHGKEPVSSKITPPEPALFDEEEIVRRRIEARRDTLEDLQLEISETQESHFAKEAFDETGLISPQGISEELIKVDAQSRTLHQKGADIISRIAAFQKDIHQFEATKKAWGVFLRGSPFAEDQETQAIKKRLRDVRDFALKELAQIKGQQKIIAAYGRKIVEAGLKLRREKEEERITKQTELLVRGATIDSAKKANEEKYGILERNQKNLAEKKAGMLAYRDDLDRASEGITERQALTLITRGRLQTFDNHLDDALGSLDAALQTIPKNSLQYRQISKKRDELLRQKGLVTAGLGEATETQDQETAAAVAITKGRTQEVEPGLQRIDDYLAHMVNPSIDAVSISLQALEIAKLHNGTEFERLEAHYGELFDTLESVNSVAASTVAAQAADNDRLIQGLQLYAHSLDAIEIERPNLWNATGGLMLEKVAEGWTLLTKTVLSAGLDYGSARLKDVTKKIPVVNVLAEITAGLVLDLPSGVIEGAGELVSGMALMAADPVNTVVGLGALIGRNPATGEWSTADASASWKAIGLALISYDHFEKGEIGKGAGKVVLNVLLTATGVGAATKGVQASTIAYSVAKAAGTRTSVAAGKAFATGTSVFSRELVGGLTKLPGDTLLALGKVIKAPGALVKDVKNFVRLGPVERLELRASAVQRELAQVSGQIDDFTLGGRKISDMKELTALSADELMKISPSGLIELGIHDAAAIRDLLRLRGLLAKQDRLAAARNINEGRMRNPRAAAFQNELLEDLTRGLRAEEKILFAEAYVDPLTGMLNRSGLNYLKRMIGDGKRVSLASFDADHFKAFNTILGRSFGDSMIQLIGEHFHETVRILRTQGYEVYGVRMGGEEFVLFGDVPKDILAKTMEAMAARLKSSIRSGLSPRDMKKMAVAIAKEKYGETLGGFRKALDEIGGSTSGVSGMEFSPGVNTEAAARGSLKKVDHFLENGKNRTGRGRVYVDPEESLVAAQNALDFSPHTSLGGAQNARMEVVGAVLKKDVANQFASRTPRAQELMRSFAGNKAHESLLEKFLETPPFTMEHAEVVADTLGVSIGDLRQAKVEYVRAMRDYGTYGGAATMRTLESCGPEFSAARRIEVGEFKSINETMGHTHGDTFLTWVYQKVILPTARGAGIPEGKIVIAQKGADFFYRMDNGALHMQDAFEKALQKAYSERSPAFFDIIDTDEPIKFTEIRADWIRNNKAATADQSIANMHSLTLHPT